MAGRQVFLPPAGYFLLDNERMIICMDNIEIFSTQEWGYNRDEVGACIVKLNQRNSELNKKYQSLLKRHKKLNEKYTALSEKRKTEANT